MNDTVKIFNSNAEIYLEYDLLKLRAILDSLRLEKDSFTASLLREYEHELINAVNVETDRAIREQAERNAGHQEVKERTSDD